MIVGWSEYVTRMSTRLRNDVVTVGIRLCYCVCGVSTRLGDYMCARLCNCMGRVCPVSMC